MELKYNIPEHRFKDEFMMKMFYISQVECDYEDLKDMIITVNTLGENLKTIIQWYHDMNMKEETLNEYLNRFGHRIKAPLRWQLGIYTNQELTCDTCKHNTVFNPKCNGCMDDPDKPNLER